MLYCQAEVGPEEQWVYKIGIDAETADERTTAAVTVNQFSAGNAASFRKPRGLCFGPDGNLIVRQRIRSSRSITLPGSARRSSALPAAQRTGDCILSMGASRLFASSAASIACMGLSNKLRHRVATWRPHDFKDGAHRLRFSTVRSWQTLSWCIRRTIGSARAHTAAPDRARGSAARALANS